MTSSRFGSEVWEVDPVWGRWLERSPSGDGEASKWKVEEKQAQLPTHQQHQDHQPMNTDTHPTGSYRCTGRVSENNHRLKSMPREMVSGHNRWEKKFE